MAATMTATKGWALVTGASSGLGAELARQLAARRHDLVLTARRRDRLVSLAAELRTRHGIEVLVVPCDLAAAGGPAQVLAALDEKQIVPAILVNNAGFGVHGLAVEQSVLRQLEMIDLNVRALTELSLSLGAQMAARGSGAIVNVASTGAFQPAPYVAAYAATKAYVLSFSHALSWELAPRGVRVLALCPGATRTEFFEAGQVHVAVGDIFYMSAERCAQIALRALDGGRRVVVTGWLNALGAWLARVLPQWLVVPVSARMMRPVPRPGLPWMKD
jgi:short-subunit dehydrogenase